MYASFVWYTQHRFIKLLPTTNLFKDMIFRKNFSLLLCSPLQISLSVFSLPEESESNCKFYKKHSYNISSKEHTLSSANLSAVKIYENMLAFKRYGKGTEYFILQTNLGEASLGIPLQHF